MVSFKSLNAKLFEVVQNNNLKKDKSKCFGPFFGHIFSFEKDIISGQDLLNNSGNWQSMPRKNFWVAHTCIYRDHCKILSITLSQFKGINELLSSKNH